eukprot:1161654-Pelagomonas_calceolata.AAC.18
MPWADAMNELDMPWADAMNEFDMPWADAAQLRAQSPSSARLIMEETVRQPSRMIDLLQKWQPPASPGAQDSAAAAAAAAAKEQGGQGLHQTATGGVGRRGKIEAKPGTRHASRQQESPGLTRGLSTSVSSFEPPLAPERSSKLRRSRSASASPGAADSADMAFTYVAWYRRAVQAADNAIRAQADCFFLVPCIIPNYPVSKMVSQ